MTKQPEEKSKKQLVKELEADLAIAMKGKRNLQAQIDQRDAMIDRRRGQIAQLEEEIRGIMERAERAPERIRAADVRIAKMEAELEELGRSVEGEGWTRKKLLGKAVEVLGKGMNQRAVDLVREINEGVEIEKLVVKYGEMLKGE